MPDLIRHPGMQLVDKTLDSRPNRNDKTELNEVFLIATQSLAGMIKNGVFRLFTRLSNLKIDNFLKFGQIIL